MAQLRVRVDGMSCRHCVREVTARLRDVPGVETVAADARSNEVVLGGTMSQGAVVTALAGLSYRFQVLT